MFKVAAALVFGPTRRSKGQSWTTGGGDVSDGGAPRTAEQNAGLKPYADKGVLREYCQPGDPICAPHTENTKMEKHLDYFDKFGDDAAAWVIDLARKASSNDDQQSGGSKMLHKTISHPAANVIILLLVAFVL
jgi:acetylxylan esterase